MVTPSSALGAGAGVLLDPPVKKFEMLLKKPPELDELDELDLAENAFLGTLIDKMNHLYFDNPNARDVFAELVLTAESFGDSLGLGAITGLPLQEKVNIVAQQQLQQLARCQKLQQLQTLKTSALQDADSQIEWTYQFQEQLSTEEPKPIQSI